MTHALTFLDALACFALGLSQRDATTARPAQAQAGPDVDPATLTQAQRGQTDAQAALVRGLQDVWYRYALSILRDPEQAKDAAQETALRFLKGLASFRGDSRLKTWSLGIAANVCRERLRKHGGKRKTLTLTTDQANIDTAPGPGKQAELREQRDRLLAVLGDLPGRQREAVVLRYFEQLSVRDTAEAMDCAEGTVKATLSQAIRSMRQRLGADHDEA